MPDKKDEAILQLTEALNEATAKLKEQDAAIKELTAKPGLLGKVTHVLGDMLILDDRVIMDKPTRKELKNLEEGTYVHITQGQCGQVGIVASVPIPPRPAMTMKVGEILPDGRVFIDSGQGNLIPLRKCEIKCEVGDRLLLAGEDPTTAIAIENLGKETKHFQFTDELGVTWDDIGGLEAAKKDMREAIEYPILYAKFYEAMGKRPLKGVLLEGPPGCGKTLLAKAAASALSKIHGKTAVTSGYIYVKGPEVLSKWVGEAEGTIRSLFAMAREHKKKHGYPAILFVDECEALLSRRGSGLSSDMEKTIVPSFLAELDGLSDSGAMVILATNRAERLDSAVVRDGRIDRKIRVSRPDKKETTEIFNIHLSKVPSARRNLKSLSAHAAERLFSRDYILCDVSLSIYDHPTAFTLGHVASGAMVAGIVDKATSIILRHSIDNRLRDVPTLETIHLEQAVAQTYDEQRFIDHTADISLYAENKGAKVEGITKTSAV